MTNAADESPRHAPRGAYAKSARTQAAILEAALEVYAESGYRSGTLRGVADRVGISEAGLLHHFPSKSALLAAALDRRDKQAELVIDFDASGPEILRGLIRVVEQNATTPGVVDLFCLLSSEATSPKHPAHDYFVKRYEYARSSIRRAFEKLRDDGLLREGVTAERASVATIALMDGLQVQWLLDRQALDMATELKALLALLVRMDFHDASGSRI
ncbi:TetR/AcrR family transcriptional regulator [Microbacterium invictum]|nr:MULTISPECIES: TetR/AcrR family transcriptional regulator [Microbacterium]